MELSQLNPNQAGGVGGGGQMVHIDHFGPWRDPGGPFIGGP